jgi:hypothetical protein
MLLAEMTEVYADGVVRGWHRQPITIQNDTVIYNSSSFRVWEKAILEDPLKMDN